VVACDMTKILLRADNIGRFQWVVVSVRVFGMP